MTVNKRLSSLRSLYRHAVGAPLVVSGMRAVQRRRALSGNGSPVTALLEAARGGSGLKGLRDVALLSVVHDSGLYVVGKGHQGEREPSNRMTYRPRSSCDPS